MNKITLGSVVALLLVTSCTSIQIQDTIDDIQSKSSQFLHEQGIVVKNDPTKAFDVAPYRTNTPDKQATSISISLKNSVFSNPEANLQTLVNALLKGVDDPFRQVKILHDWIALNISYDEASSINGSSPDQSYQNVLKSKKALSKGYSNLFIKMCSYAEIKCKEVSGTVRSSGFNPIKKVNLGLSDVWNAVLLQGNWYLLDIPWDSCWVKGCGGCSSKRQYSTNYFLLDPSLMIYTHFPTSKTWQLLSKPIDKDGFFDSPPLTAEFFTSVNINQDGIKAVNNVGSQTSLLLSIKPEMQLKVMLETDPATYIEGTTFLKKEGDYYRLQIAFPKAGEYRLVFLTGKKKSSIVESTGVLFYIASEGTDFRFPNQSWFDL